MDYAPTQSTYKTELLAQRASQRLTNEMTIVCTIVAIALNLLVAFNLITL